MMRHLSQEIASGSEERVTNEETWISWHCKWSGSETECQYAGAEESEEHEESKEHDDSNEHEEF